MYKRDNQPKKKEREKRELIGTGEWSWAHKNDDGRIKTPCHEMEGINHTKLRNWRESSCERDMQGARDMGPQQKYR